MKTNWNIKTGIQYLIITALFIVAGTGVFAQDKKASQLKDFKVVIEKTKTGIFMHGIEGTAWIDLTFTLNNYRPQAINENGMTDLNNTSAGKDPVPATFLFTVTKTMDGILLKGMKGTAWEELSFPLRFNEKQAIDQFGMVKPE